MTMKNTLMGYVRKQCWSSSSGSCGVMGAELNQARKLETEGY